MKILKIISCVLCTIIVIFSFNSRLNIDNQSEYYIGIKNILIEKKHHLRDSDIKIGEVAYSPICLQSPDSNQQSLNKTLALNGDYLVVSDPEANEILVYRHKTEEGWVTIAKIKPPKESFAEKRGYGFGYGLAINNNIIAISSYNYKYYSPIYVFNRSKRLDYELFTATIDTNFDTVALQQLSLPEELQIVSPMSLERVAFYYTELEFVDQKIALLGKNRIESNDNNYIFLINPVTSEIDKNIKLPNLPSQSPRLYANNKSLFLFYTWSPLKHRSIYTVEDGKLIDNVFDERLVDAIFDSQVVSDFQKLSLTRVAISNNLITLVLSTMPFRSNATIIFKPYSQKFSSGKTYQHGLVDARDPLVLISVLSDHPIMGNKSFDHFLFEANENEVIVKSQISWERYEKDEIGSYIPTKGVIASDSLIVSAYGAVISLPLKNLPEVYKIKPSICRSK
ncbi:MAG: hypothetical protein AAGE84_27240 [Cyanobacteria bacterium P01_G01_bin.39]